MPTVSETRLRIQSGRVDGLLSLLAARSGDRSGVTVLLSGAPGVGKSTSAAALLRGLAGRVRRAFRVTADEPSRRRPFDLIAGLVGLVPEYPPLPDLGDRVLAAVEEMCAAGPLALCAEDLHHADGDSLRVLGQLVDATHDLPLTLVLACRPLPVRDQLIQLAHRSDVLQVDVVAMDRPGLADLVRRRWGVEPTGDLLDQLNVAGGNPFHAGILLDDLRRAGRVSLDGGSARLTDDGTTPADGRTPDSVQNTIRTHLAMLDEPVRDLLQVLAVWGRPADVIDLAAVAGSPPAAVLRGVQAAVTSGVTVWTDDDLLAFAHDLYQEVLLADLAPGLRRLLHGACAQRLQSTGGLPTEIVGHTGDASARGVDVRQALQMAATDLAFAPEQAAELLASVSTVPGTALAAEVAVARAGALAAAGRMAESEEVALAALAITRDAAARNTLTRLLLHATISTGLTDTALASIDHYLPDAETDPEYHHALVHLRRWVVTLSATEPVPAEPDPGPIRSGAALVPTAMQLFYRARCVEAFEMIIEAEQARVARRAPVWGDGVTAPVWAPWFALYGNGPVAAKELSQEARRKEQPRRGWLWPYHLSVAGVIDQFAGRWDDALTVFEESARAADGTGTSWVSRVTGGRLQILIQRGLLDDATAIWETWQAAERRHEGGLPLPSLGALLLAEARGNLDGAAVLAEQVWGDRLRSGHLLWTLLAGPDVARVARLAGADGLLRRVVADLAEVPTDQVPALAGVVPLVGSIASGDADLAAQAALANQRAGHVVAELYSWEQAAVAAAAGGDRDLGRTWAKRALTVAGQLGARTVERRMTARLREHHLRLGVSGSRRRPTTGWGSLTATELRIAEQVGQGLTSPQIAAQLYLSPRTVQTHISNILRKLDLHSRVEIATVVARQR